MTWGGGEPLAWRGRVAVNAGGFSQLAPLGLDADSANWLWLEPDAVVIQEPRPGRFDGCDFTLTADLNADITIDLTSELGPDPVRLHCTLEELLSGPQSWSLAEDGTRLELRRAPGDALRVTPERGRVVYAPGEPIRLRVEPGWLAETTPRLAPIRLTIRSVPGSKEIQTQTCDPGWGTAGQPRPAFDVECQAPDKEGVYDLLLEAPVAGFPLRFGWHAQARVSRSVQIVVVDKSLPAAAALAETAADSWEVAIDPANPKWRTLLASTLPKLPGTRKAPWNNGRVRLADHTLGPVWQLQPQDGAAPAGWQAFPLPVYELGQPHDLEVDFPSNVPQSVAVSILEANAAGELVPLGVDSGFYLEEPLAGAARFETHRVRFYPRTNHPVVWIANRRSGQPAWIGQIRIKTVASPLRQTAAEGKIPTRTVAAYLNRPLFCELFSAPESLESSTQQSLKDWHSYYTAGTRIMDYLADHGYNALVMPAIADGATMYPSQHLPGLPRYDTGTFFETGQDLQSKDVLELMLQLADRSGVGLIPSIQFATPLPELEIALRSNTAAEDVLLTHADGTSWLQAHGTSQGLAPYYNPLCPQVQAAMTRLVLELADHCGPHASFQGLAITLSANGFAQFPGAEWGMDKVTLARFARSTGTTLAAGTHTEQARQVLEQYRGLWLRWRAAELAAFYGSLQKQISRTYPGKRLVLIPAESLDSPHFQYRLRPVLPQRESAALLFLEAGIDPGALAGPQRPLLLRPFRAQPSEVSTGQTMAHLLQNSDEVARFFCQDPQGGSVFFHEPKRLPSGGVSRHAAFRETDDYRIAQAAPAAYFNRERFALALAGRDDQFWLDGGWTLPLGQEAAVADMFRAFRSLPAKPMPLHSGSTYPVVIRALAEGGRLSVSLVNTSANRAFVQLQLAVPCDVVQAVPKNDDEQAVFTQANRPWQMELPPFGMQALQLQSRGKNLSGAELQVIEIAEDVPSAAVFNQAIQQLGDQVAQLTSPPEWDVVLNADFEMADPDGRIIAWQPTGEHVLLESRDRPQPPRGDRFAVLTVQPTPFSADAAEPAPGLESDSFPPPQTGRLAISLAMRAPDENPAVPMKIILQGELNGRPYRRATLIDGSTGGPRLSSTWTRYEFQMRELPQDGLTNLRVRVELQSPGEVWLDDVRVSALSFSDKELLELRRIILSARLSLEAGNLENCARLLRGYWTDYLRMHVPPGADSEAPPQMDDTGPNARGPESDAVTQAPPEESPRVAQPPKKPLWNRIRKWKPFQ